MDARSPEETRPALKLKGSNSQRDGAVCIEMAPVALLHRSVLLEGDLHWLIRHCCPSWPVGGCVRNPTCGFWSSWAHWYPRTLAPWALNTDNKAVQTLESKVHVFKSSFFLWLSGGISRQSGVLEKRAPKQSWMYKDSEKGNVCMKRSRTGVLSVQTESIRPRAVLYLCHPVLGPWGQQPAGGGVA